MRYARRAVAATLVILALSGCTSPDLSPVPTTAEEPFACTGVPRGSAELLLGGAVDVESEYGAWGGDFGEDFECTIERGDASVYVREEINGLGEDQWEGFKTGGDPIEADAPGKGVIRPGEDSAWAGWACGRRTLLLSVTGPAIDGRDVREDTEALLVSMLPWTCEGEAPPARSE